MTIVRWGYLGVASIAVIRVAVACGGTEGAGPAPLGDASIDDAATGTPDGARDPNVPGPDADLVLPSYCSGIVLYASFDTGLVANVGGGEPFALGTAQQTPDAHFGGGLELERAVTNDAGSALYFTTPDGGGPVFPENEGSLAMWVRGNVTAGNPVYYRPVATLPPAPLVSAGLTLLTNAGRFGLVNATPVGAPQNVLTFALPEVRPYLRPDDFNHFATSWRRGDAAGPTAYLTINGGLGKNYLPNADPDASDPYADAGPSDAGNLRVPYRGYSSMKWDYDASAVALRLGAPNIVNAPDATIDDVAVWNRVLSFDEIAAAYGAGVPIREACHLP